MKKLLAVMICGVLILSVTGLASAGQKSGPYIGAAIGESKLAIDEREFDFRDHDIGYKIFGGYNFGIIPLIDLGVEGSYVDFGEASDIQILNRNVGVTAWDLFGVGCVNLGPVGLFAKLGRVWWDSDANLIERILDDSGNDMAYGLGVRFQVGPVALRAEYERFDTNKIDIDYLSAGVAWTF